MQNYNPGTTTRNTPQTLQKTSLERETTGVAVDMQETARAAERARLRQGIMHVRVRHFYCTLEEMFDPALRGQCFVVGTGMGRPNEPGRVIDASQAATRLGISPGMPLRRAHRLAPRMRFLPASHERYQPVLQQLRERYRAYSRIIESIPIADAFIDLRGCELPFDTPVSLAERLCAEVAEMVAHLRDFGLTSFAQVAALTEDGLQRRLGKLGSWIWHVALGEDMSLVVPDAPPLSQNARVRFNHAADADETCAAIRKLANYLGERMREQRLKGQQVALLLWPNRFIRRETRKLVLSEEGEEMAVTMAEET